MKQNYHVNANTNSHSRAIIRCANTSNIDLARRFGVSTKTIAKWRGRDFIKDKTSRPKTMHYALNETERELIRVVRTLTWLALDDLTDSGLEFTDRFVTKDKQVSGKHKFDKLCSLSEIEHRLTKPATPKTNGMVERVNGTIKNATVKAMTYQNIDVHYGEDKNIYLNITE